MVVFVTVMNGVRSMAFKVETAAGLIASVHKVFGEGFITDPNGVALTAEYGNLEEGVYIWSSGNDPWRHRLLTLREALRMPLPEPDQTNEPQPDSVEGKSTAYRTSPAGGVVTWEMAPGGQVGLNNAIRQFADSAEDTERRFDSFPRTMRAVKGRETLAQDALFSYPVRMLNLIMKDTSGGSPYPAWVMESITDNIEALGGLQLGVSSSTPPTAQPGALQQVPQVRSFSGLRGSSTGRLRSDFALVSKGPEPAAGPGGAASSEAAGPGGASSSGAAWAAWMTWRQAAMRFNSVAEVKRFSKVVRDGLSVDLMREYSKEPPDALSRSVRAMLDQLWTYMVVTGVEFSWFSCYYFTWIAWRSHDDPTQLRLSQPFRHDTDGNSGITVLAALAWLQDQALSRLDLRHHSMETTVASLVKRDDSSDSDDEDHPDPKDAGEISPGKNDPPYNPEKDTRKRHGTDLPPRSNKKHGQVQQGADPGDTGMPPHSNKGQNQTSVSVPLLAARMLGPLGDLIGEGSSCFVRLAEYHGQEAAVKMLMSSHQPYKAALKEATMYQVLQPLQGSVLPILFGAGRLAFGTPFVATSVVRGARLSDLQSFTPAVCDAARMSLSRIHALGVAHGDIGLDNLLLVAGGTDAEGSDDNPSGSGSPVETFFLQPLRPALDTTTGDLGSGSGNGTSSGSPSSHRHTSVVIVDLGRAYVCLEPEELAWEMDKLNRLLE